MIFRAESTIPSQRRCSSTIVTRRASLADPSREHRVIGLRRCIHARDTHQLRASSSSRNVCWNLQPLSACHGRGISSINRPTCDANSVCIGELILCDEATIKLAHCCRPAENASASTTFSRPKRVRPVVLVGLHSPLFSVCLQLATFIEERRGSSVCP